MRIPTRVSRELLAALNHTAATTGSSRNAIVARVVEKAVARFPEEARGRRAFRQRLAAQRVRGTPTETLSIELPDETARALGELGGRNRYLKPSALLRLLLAREFLSVEVAAPASLARARDAGVIRPARPAVLRGRPEVLERSPASQWLETRPLPERLPRQNTGIRCLPRQAPAVVKVSEQVVNLAVQLKPYLRPEGRVKLGPMLAAAGISVPDNLNALPLASGGAFDRAVSLLQLSPLRAGSAGATICPACVPYGGTDGRLEACPDHEEQALRMLWDRARGT